MKTDFNENSSHIEREFKGIVRGTRQRFGFLNVSGHSDIFIKPQEMDKVFAGDTVNILVENYGKDNQNVIVNEIFESAFTECVGVFTEDGTGAYVLPDDYGFNRRIRIPNAYRKRAEDGDYVRVEIIEHPFKSKKPKAKVVEVIGKPSNSGIESDYFLSKFKIATKLTHAIREESAEVINDFHKKTNQLKRKNLTKLNFVTIDGDNTIDIDDAVYVQKLKNKWKLLVAISDVAEYIDEGSSIDNEAYKRTSTVYLTGRTIPMLPAELAHEYLSLRPMEKKSVLVADMTLSLNGELEKYEFYEALIESKAKLTYSEIDHFLETGFCSDNVLAYKKEIQHLADLQVVLKKGRRDNNVIPAKRFDYKYLLNEERQIEHIESLESQQSYRLIEEAMLLANRCAADFVSDTERGLFKGQYGVVESKKKALSQYLRQFVFFENSMFENFEDFKHLYKLIEKEPNAEDIKQVINLNLRKSVYSKTAEKHFVMGFDSYTYFTSPIRRYMDILVHRMIKAKIHKKNYEVSREGYMDHFSATEKRINDCASSVEHWLKANYINKHANVEFPATIVGINQFGINIKIDINGIEGFIPIGDVCNKKDIFKKSEFDYVLGNKSYKIMDRLTVKLKDVQEGNSLIFLES